MHIYCLIDPRTGEIRYVGVTVRDLSARLAAHVNERTQNHKNRWIRVLERQGLIPIIRHLQDVPDETWQEAERYWIAYFTSIGCALTNMTEGGEGSVGYEHSDDAKAKMSRSRIGKTKSDKHKAKISAGLMGHEVSEETRSKLREKRKTYVVSDDTKAKMSKSLKGRIKTPEECAAISKGKLESGYQHSEETRARFRSAWERRRQRPVSAEAKSIERDNRSKSSKEMWESETYKTKRSEALKKYNQSDAVVSRRYETQQQREAAKERRRVDRMERRAREAAERAAFAQTPEGRAAQEAKKAKTREQCRLAQQRFRDRKRLASSQAEDDTEPPDSDRLDSSG